MQFTPFCLLFACYLLAGNGLREGLGSRFLARLTKMEAKSRPSRPALSKFNNRGRFRRMDTPPAAVCPPSWGVG
jgi:hypothetical protein